MSISPSRSSLYRRARRLVNLLAACLVCVQIVPGQTPHGAKPYKGPRALGLVELTPDKKPQFIPIAILVNGEFYDAGAYKADPVPMALWSETVYEGLRTGVSQGLFTVTSALENPKTNEWIAEGTWLPAGSIPAKSAKKHESSVPRGIDEDAGPPVLRHSGANKPAPPATSTTPTSSAPDNTKPASNTQPASSQGAPPSAPPQNPTATSTAPASAPSATPPTTSTEEDPNAPVLRRGKPAPRPAEALTPPAPVTKAATRPISAPASAKAPSVQQFAAISDIDGPEPRPYSYDLKPEDEQQFRKKMLALATDEITARAKMLHPDSASSLPARAPTRRSPTKKAQPTQPDFLNVQLRVFDLSSSNEPVLVLSANALMPKTSSGPASAATDLQYTITLVAREDINGDFHKAFSQVTDDQHLDVLPRYELIDAVDADGDGRGELLFREVSDTSSAFAIFRVIGDRLYPLFQGAL